MERGILLQNIIDDVGQKNLRFFKEHLGPAVMLKKYSVIYMPSDEEDLPGAGSEEHTDTELPLPEGTKEDSERVKQEQIKDDLNIDVSEKRRTGPVTGLIKM